MDDDADATRATRALGRDATRGTAGDGCARATAESLGTRDDDDDDDRGRDEDARATTRARTREARASTDADARERARADDAREADDGGGRSNDGGGDARGEEEEDDDGRDDGRERERASSESDQSDRSHLDRDDGSETASASASASASRRPAANVAYPMFLCDERHRDSARLYADDDGDDDGERQKWRTKDRMKTVSVALVLCLNIGVDPPDTMKISPCARMQCWINPMSAQPQNELDAIGKALQAQYERWQPRAKYKLQLDPTTEDMKKLCISCRRNAKGERVLLHYNGHGVPKPTANGEIWVFNKSYTQYIPLSVFDLQAWTGTPAIYVFDCSNAGLIVKSFLKLSDPSAAPKMSPPTTNAGLDLERRQIGRSFAFAELEHAQPKLDAGDSGFGPTNVTSTANECILIAACGANEILPQSADLPADVFSACLTTPVKMALHWFCSNSVLRGQGISADIIDNIPGMQNNRKTPLGELNWIFTAITDTIAWNVLPRSLFQRLFRQDLLVASLFRNFLLAERIMRANNCTPVSSPRLPPTHQHPMWAAWDMAVEQCLLQMPALLSGNPDTEFVPSPFFTDQLTAFEVWLEYGSENDAPPEQLPIVLQVLLSQSHRLRALILLGRFLDLGLWAVELALSVGIFPYVLKLLQTTAPELRQILVFIWTKILALDRSCQADLVKDDGHAYFIRFLQSSNVPVEERAMAAFILAVISDGHEKGQTVCMASGLMEICLLNIPEAALPETGSPFFLRWLCLCLGKLWEDNVEAQKAACNAQAHAMLATLFAHSSPDARAAAVYSLGSLISIGHTLDPDLLQREDSKDDSQTQELMHAMSSTSVLSTQSPSPRPLSSHDGQETLPQENFVSSGAIPAMEREVAINLLTTAEDASPMVRVETAVALSRIARAHKVFMREAAIAWKRDYDTVTARRVVESKRSENISSRRRFSSSGSFGGFDHSIGSTKGMSTVDEDGDRPTSSLTVENVARSADAQQGLLDSHGECSDGGSIPLPPTYPQSQYGDDWMQERTTEGPKGGLYTQILQVLLDLATDAAPSVSAAGIKALMSVGLEMTHPIMEKATSTGSFAKESSQEAKSKSHRRQPSFASLDLGSSERSSSKDLTTSPSGSLMRTESWSQRLTSIGSRLLGSPTKPKPASTLSGTREPGAQSPSKASGGRGARFGGLRKQASGGKDSSFQGGGQSMSSSHLPALNIPRVGSRTSDLRLSPRNDSPLRRTTSTLISDHDPGYDSSGTLPRFGSHASLESLESPRIGGGSNDTSRFDHAHGDELPRSMIYKRSCAHFSMALLESAQEEEESEFDDDFTSDVPPWLRAPDTKRRADRLRRMYERMAETRTTEEHRLKMTEYVSSIDVGGGGVVPTSIIMHSLEPQAVAGDNRGRVHVWDHTSSRMVNKIETGLKSTDMLSLVNETDDALLLTGCVDGSVKIWRDYDKIGGESLVTAWNTLPSPTILPDTGSTGSLPMSLYKPSTHYNAHESTKAVIVWQQLTGCLYATGNAPHPLLRVWDVSSELCRETLSLQSQGTCLTAEGALLMAGTADGAVLSYDLRAPARLLSAMQTHTQPVISILLQPGGEDNLLITGCSDGQIKFCDLRNASKPFLTTEVSRPSAVPNRTPSLTALVGHPCARVIASGSSERAIKLWDLQGHNFASIQYTNSFLGQRIGSVTALSFHPNLMYLAAGSSAGHATIYSH